MFYIFTISVIMSGIGIDDMFVVVQCWMNLQKSGKIEGKVAHHNKISYTLRKS
jgi:hypothetical protein